MPGTSGEFPVKVHCCPDQEQLHEYATGDLDSRVCEVIDLHLGDCPRCRRAGDLVEKGRLTPYQAAELLEGRGGGLVLGNYVLLEPAGAGGMGYVFRAWHRHMKRVVALKVVAPELLRSAAARARFQREI